MLRKRIIFTLIYSDGYFNQSRNFRLQKVGDINWLENNYKFNRLEIIDTELGWPSWMTLPVETWTC